ncbi:unnamed protein product [Brassica rapa]|uniref:Uncharacterized protein n=1 Tax=Brassica campestris TaxID=3711 RepID=A0A3P6A4B5_BRACM|nr:unnamed protein product [Brassica rapa]VDC79820.1 unnamed protein product [Brassica rapa]
MMIFQIYFSDLEVGRCKEASNLQKVGELIGVNMVLLDKKADVDGNRTNCLNRAHCCNNA